MARQTWAQKIANALAKLFSGQPLGRQTVVPPTPQAQRAAARGHAAGEYHFGRISNVRNEKGNIVGYRVGPVPDPGGETYRGARAATYDHVIKMLRKVKSEDVTVAVYGRMYPGEKRFKWLGDVFDREQLITNLEEARDRGDPMETAVFDIFGLENTPDLVLAWFARPHTS